MNTVSENPIRVANHLPMLLESVSWIYEGTCRIVTKCIEIGSLAAITSGWTIIAWTMTGILLAPVSIIFTPITAGTGAFLT